MKIKYVLIVAIASLVFTVLRTEGVPVKDAILTVLFLGLAVKLIQMMKKSFDKDWDKFGKHIKKLKEENDIN